MSKRKISKPRRTINVSNIHKKDYYLNFKQQEKAHSLFFFNTFFHSFFSFSLSFFFFFFLILLKYFYRSIFLSIFLFLKYTSCKACPFGQFGDTHSLIGCSPCPPGQHSVDPGITGFGATQCSMCPSGQIPSTSKHGCDDCGKL